MDTYAAPRWLLGGGTARVGPSLAAGHLQTIWPVLFSRWHRGAAPRFRRERWTTPDGDFIDVDFAAAHDLDGTEPPAPGAPLLVLFHGLEGSSESHYAVSFADAARERGWAYAVPHFRGCSGEPNLAPRAYHSGDYEEIGWILGQLRARPGMAGRPMLVVGISLGGNALLRWAEEAGDAAPAVAQAVASVCSPVDLAAGGAAMGQGFNLRVYTPRFLRTMKPRALHKWKQHPGLFDRDRLRAARTLYEFDDVFTAPLHGFAGTDDYWRRASAKPHLRRIRVPALVLHARNDPFVPAASLPRAEEVGDWVTLWQPQDGGHVGFPQGALPGHVLGLPQAVLDWMFTTAGIAPANSLKQGDAVRG